MFEPKDLQSLLKLYSRAIEFFSGKGDSKRYKFYKKKLQTLMIKPRVIEIISNKAPLK